MAFFGNREHTPDAAASAPPASASPDDGRISRIGEGVRIVGRIEGNETVRIDGQIEGDLDLQSDLVIGPHGRVKAKVHARSIAVEGSVEGDLSADGRIDLVRTARVTGTIKARSISVAEGARFDGTIDMSAKGR